ncbi:MAG: alpha/beta hydrolase [Spirochaetes bacterium]|nr:alpha/beta hydrolase [Spirochaetota bacterium]
MRWLPIKFMKKIIFYIIALAVLSNLFCAGRPYFMYYPEKEIKATPSDIDLNFESIRLKTKDDTIIIGWWIPSDQAKGVVLYSHGNSGNISHCLEIIQIFNKLSLSVFIYDYRGYGESEGEPSEMGTYMDSEAAWLYLVNERGIERRKIIIFGRSLGGSISAWLADSYTPGILIIESSFRSLTDVSHDRYPWFPGKLIFGDSYSTYRHLQKIKCPVLIIHSKDDEISPFSQGEKIFHAANEPKELLVISGSHNRGFLESRNEYESGIDSFISKYLK